MNAQIRFDNGRVILTLLKYPYWSISVIDNVYTVYQFADSEITKRIAGVYNTLADALECVIRN